MNSECFFSDDNSVFSGVESAFLDIGKCLFRTLKGCCDGLETLENMSDTWKRCCETGNPCRQVPHPCRQSANLCRKNFVFVSVCFVC